MRSKRFLAFKLGLAILAIALLVSPNTARAHGAEAAKVHVLLVLDTDDRMGATWGLDGENMKALIENMVKKQGLDDRVVIDHFTGGKVTAKLVLDFYKQLDVGPDDALMFYFSGHGGFDKKKGHFMAFTHGWLYRNDLLAAMDKRKPRLRVVLTDCCANYTDQPIDFRGLPVDFRQSLLAGAHAIPDQRERQTERREVVNTANAGNKGNEPPSKELPLPRESPTSNSTKKARLEEPPMLRGGIIRTTKGGMPFEKILDKTDGKMLRDLLFRHVGLVDINGCQIGKLSMGTYEWGGSVFTNAFLLLQMEPSSKFASKKDSPVTWEGFYPQWQKFTDEIARAYTNKQASQQPHAWQLGHNK